MKKLTKRLTQRDAAANAVYWRRRHQALPRWRVFARRKAEGEALYWEILVSLMKPNSAQPAPYKRWTLVTKSGILADMAYYDVTEYETARDEAEFDRAEELHEARREGALDDIEITWVRRRAVDIPVSADEFDQAMRPQHGSMF